MKWKFIALTIMALFISLQACGGNSDTQTADNLEAQQVNDDIESPAQADQETPETVYASHILIPFQGCMQAPVDALTREDAMELLQSIADSIESGELTFAQAAEAHSSCPSSQRGGFLGPFAPGQMVPEFDAVAFSLEPGTVSDIFETPYGLHIVKRLPTVSASHILLAYQGAERSTATRTKDEALALITRIQEEIAAGDVTFEEAAAEYSDCPSGADGGDLGEFSRHMMTTAFEDTAFALETGEMSGIVETPFGYHLILRTE